MKSFNALWMGWMLCILSDSPHDNETKIFATIILALALIGWWMADRSEKRAERKAP